MNNLEKAYEEAAVLTLQFPGSDEVAFIHNVVHELLQSPHLTEESAETEGQAALNILERTREQLNITLN